MKTTFKRILTVILALCLLTTSAVCLMGISTSAETPDDSTVVYSYTTTGTNITFYLQSNGTAIKATGSGGQSVRYSFDYYVPSSTTGYFTARNNSSYFLTGGTAANHFDGVVNESTTGSSYLAEGTIGHLDVTMQAKSGSARTMYAGIGGATGTVYIWNPKAWVDGNEVTVSGLGGTATTYGEVEFEEGTFDEVSPASPAFTWTSAAKNAGLSLQSTFGGGAVNTGWGWGSNAYISNTLAAENAYIKMSFDYYNEAADDVFLVTNPSVGFDAEYVSVTNNTNVAASGDNRYLGTGFGSVEFKAIKYGDDNIYAGITAAKDAETGKTLYFWNVKYEIYVDGETNNTNVYPTSFSSGSATTYGAISSVLEEGMKAFPVTEWAPADTTDTLTFIGANRSDIVIDAAKNDTITISYDYYTTDARYYRSTFNGTDFYGMQLPSGRNQFEQTVTVTADGEVIPTFEITTTESAAADEFIRLWNVKITHNDTEIEAYPVIANGSGTLNMLTFDDTTEYDENKTDYMVMLDMRGVSEDVLSEIEGSKVMSIVYAPARTTDTDTVSISFDYFVSGEASYIRNAYNADGNGHYGAIASDSQVLNPDAGIGSMSHTSAADKSFAAGVGVGPCPSALFSSTNYANFFYTWDVVLTSENCGTLRYIQQFDLVKTYCESNYITPYAEEMEYDEAEFTNEAKYVVKGDVNSDDVADICDLVYLAIDTNTIFKDYRTFDGDDDYTVKSAEDYDVVRDGIYSFEY